MITFMKEDCFSFSSVCLNLPTVGELGTSLCPLLHITMNKAICSATVI